MAEATFAEVYRGVPAAQAERLLAFRAAHPRRRLDVDGAAWSYLAGGRGDAAILLPAGGERIGDIGFPLVKAFEPDYRVVYASYPSYPPLPTMRALVDGLARLLDAEGVGPVHVIGASFGDDVAQCFVRAHPERVRSLILANTGVPEARLGRLTRFGGRLFAALPEGLLRALVGRALARAVAAPPEERAFWRAAMAELAAALTKRDLLATFADTVDYRLDYTFAPDDLRDWPGKILVLDSDDDPGVSPTMRAALRAMYPGAEAHTFHGAGHTPFLSRPEEYFAVVRPFLRAAG